MSNVKNYTNQGGEITVIGGTLEITSDGKITFEGVSFGPLEAQADSVATTIEDLNTDFNALLAKLKAAGLMSIE